MTGRAPEPPSDDVQALSPGDLRERVLIGVRWVSLMRFSSEVLAFGSAILLARLIPPADFGRAALAYVAVAFAYALVSDFFSNALVQWKSVSASDWQTAFALSLALAAVLTAVLLVLVEPLIEPLFGAETADLFLLTLPVFFLAALQLVPRARMTRDLNFRSTSMLNIAGDLARAATAVSLAVLGLDAEALILGAVMASVIGTVGALLLIRPPRPRVHRRSARNLIGFGAPAAGSSLLWTTEQNIDYLILGARLSPSQLGFYWRAYTVGVEYQAKITAVMAGMAFPVYSRTSGLEHMRELRMRVLRVHAVVVVPLVALLIVLAPELIPLLFGERWEPAVVPAQILGVAGIFAALSTGSGPVVLAAGKPKPLLVWNIAKVTCISLAVFLTAPHGIVAVAVAVAAYRLLECLASYYFLLWRLVGIPLRQLWYDASPGVISSLPLLAVAVGTSAAASAADLPTVAHLTLVSLAGAASYLVTLRVLFRPAWRDLGLVIQRTLGRTPHSNLP